MPTNATIHAFSLRDGEEIKKWIEILRSIEDGNALTGEDLLHLRLLRIHLAQRSKEPAPEGPSGSR